MFTKSNLLAISAIALGHIVYAQTSDTHTIGVTIPSVMLMELQGSSHVNIPFTAPTTAGAALSSTATNNDLYINYSYIKSASDKTAKINVKITDTSNLGYTIKVVASDANSSGAGTKGEPTSQVTLTTTDTPIITGIGSSYTGSAAGDGHRLTYTAEFSTYANLVTGSTATESRPTVTYTITDL